MKKFDYEELEIELVEFETDDIVTSSTCPEEIEDCDEELPDIEF